ncbi:MAG TPA: HlyD family efflux transporter periplasmic adaptor subunit [Gemmataceae bacterium]|nr:HlyD family efflux transporter periplasmic adaptor subunit [Gemmataceae bacterium]
MSTTRRPLRFFWLLGILLLLGTAVGAGWMLNHAPAQNGPTKGGSTESVRVQPGADVIWALGYVDVERGIALLHPVQPGRVEYIWVHEGDAVWEGSMLLSLDDRDARDQLKRARANLQAAEFELAKVKQLQANYPYKIKQQENAVEYARSNVKQAGHELVPKRKLFKLEHISQDELAIYEEKERGLQRLVQAEEEKLRDVKAYNFGPDIGRAEQSIVAKKADVDRARLALLECDLYAPADGTVLRLFANEGEALSRDPKVPAIQFCPNTPRIIRAEVMQEWASKVEPGQSVLIEDDTRAGPQWQGRVKFVSGQFTQRRSKVFEPFQYNDVRTRECIITLNPGDRHLYIGQRVRVIIKQGGP